jgi:hypothetical protein
VPDGAERCPTCGTRVDVHLVEIGREPAPRRRAWRREGPRRPFDRRWLLVAVAAVVAWAAVAFVMAGEDGDDTEEARPAPSSSRPRRTTTSTTTTAVPGAPLLGEKTGLVVLLSGNTTRVVDLDTGESTGFQLGSPILVREDGIVTQDGRGALMWHGFPFSDDRGVELGDGFTVFDAAGTDSVWIGLNPSSGPVGGPSGPPTRWRLIAQEGLIREEVSLPPDAWAMWANADGPIAGVGGRILQFTVDGSVRDLGVGELLGGSRASIFVRRCDEGGRCHIERQPMVGDPLVLPSPPIGSWRSYGFVGDAFGRVAGVSELPQQDDARRVAFNLVVVRPDGTVEGSLPIPPTYDPQFIWSPDNRWLLSIGAPGSLFVVDTRDFSTHEIPVGANNYLAGVLQSQG